MQVFDFNMEDFDISPKPEDKGFLYIVMDTAYPEFFKVGKTTSMSKRLSGYNSDKPYPSAYLYAISREFIQHSDAEAKVLQYLYANTNPTTFRREWFNIEYLELAMRALEAAEQQLP